MVIERFSQNLINSGIFKIYIATGFFATLIFFVVNSELFSPIEMILGSILITIILKGLSNLMLSFMVSSFSLENKKAEFDFKYNEEKINILLNQLVAKEADEKLNKDSVNNDEFSAQNNDKTAQVEAS
ncbi:hypothetical protein [Aliarcobacter butzleri]|jgi:hypothetical protein|uniref:Uncharacterized protein n=7 Tax=root TaxID=1 RepID=A0AAP4PQD9_9BACT|nr:hypothetical protein [Aliarcobacter butzleri]MCP3650378.1 hypothetical protein [Arcobacter sp. DNRA7]AGR78135.1 hypothetical protein A7H1H_1883 [Aliarcobacter butzleri 7h1h]KLD97035.1 hypothetical protein AF74_07735 [Aliarcobacter butzleri L349]KLE00749.1 hypothetical protein AF76_06605 [Aliarcobacter butzleri L351]KLE01087.1 hypothetical protein AA20_04475 [Aliarcobacter butzleri L348]